MKGGSKNTFFIAYLYRFRINPQATLPSGQSVPRSVRGDRKRDLPDWAILAGSAFLIRLPSTDRETAQSGFFAGCGNVPGQSGLK